MSDLAEFLLARIDEDEMWANEAGRHNEEPLIERGEHWQWECGEHDEVLDIDPVRDEFLECPNTQWISASLRSREHYPYRSIDGTGPSIHLTSDEVRPSLASHVARWDPARVLSECEAKRRLVDLFGPLPGQLLPASSIAGRALGMLALPYADHPDYRAEWRP